MGDKEMAFAPHWLATVKPEPPSHTTVSTRAEPSPVTSMEKHSSTVPVPEEAGTRMDAVLPEYCAHVPARPGKAAMPTPPVMEAPNGELRAVGRAR